MKRSTLFLPLLLAAAMLMAGCQPTAAPNIADNAPAVDEAATEVDVAIAPTDTAAPTEEPTAEPLEFVDSFGRTVVLAEQADYVISLAPSNTELLWSVGAIDDLVATEDFSNFPEEVADLPSIGSVYGDINTELILSFEPDLILASDLQTPEQVQELEDLGLTVFTVPNPTELDGLWDNMRTVAALTGHSDTVEDEIAALQARVEAVVAAVEDVEERPLVFYELDATDPNAPYTAGAGTFIDTLITMAGGENLGGQFSDPWVTVSSEELIAQNPDIILLGDAAWGVTVESVAERAGWDAMSAVQFGFVFPFNDDLASRPGPRMVDGLEQLAELFHPELFE